MLTILQALFVLAGLVGIILAITGIGIMIGKIIDKQDNLL